MKENGMALTHQNLALLFDRIRKSAAYANFIRSSPFLNDLLAFQSQTELIE
jgi:hypothetical protein